MTNYNLEEISKHKTPYIGNSSKVSALVRHLPVSDPYFKQQYISLQTAQTPYGLTVYYEPASDADYEGVWPMVESNDVMKTNALVLFSMIDNADEVTFAFRNAQSQGKLDTSKYDTFFTFQKAAFEEQYGDLSMLGEHLNLLEVLQYEPNYKDISLKTDALDLKEISKILFDLHLKSFTEMKVTEYARISDYKIDDMKIQKGNIDEFQFYVEYSIKPASEKYVLAGNGIVKSDGWIRHRVSFVNVKKEAGAFKIQSAGTGP